MSSLKHFRKKCAVPPIKTSLPWKKPLEWKPVLLQESLQKDLSDHCQKKDFLASEKPGKVAFWKYFFKCTSELGKQLSATISLYLGIHCRCIMLCVCFYLKLILRISRFRNLVTHQDKKIIISFKKYDITQRQNRPYAILYIIVAHLSRHTTE